MDPSTEVIRKLKNKFAAKKLRDCKRVKWQQLSLELEQAQSTITSLNDSLRSANAQLSDAKYRLSKLDCFVPMPQGLDVDISSMGFEPELLLISTAGPIVWPDNFPLMDDPPVK